MKKVKGKRIAAVICALTIGVCQAAYSASYYGAYNTADIWSEALYSEHSRMFGSSTASIAWPGGGIHHYTILGALSDDTTWDISQVFGKECQDLLFSDIKSTENYKDYFKDADRLLEPADITEHNGFIFAVANGPKADIISQTETFTYGNGETITEDVARRLASSDAGKTGNDSYLYVFDISKGENYGEALVAKWHIDDILNGDKNAFAVFESVAVSDDYICLTVNNKTVLETGKEVFSNDRGLIVLENNIKRGEGEIFPQRADSDDEIYRYGVKVMLSDFGDISIDEAVEYETAIIGDYYVMLPMSDISLTDTRNKSLDRESKIFLADLSEIKEKGIGEKLVVCTSKMYNSDERTIGTSLEDILPLEDGRNWYQVENPTLHGVKIEETQLTFLVTYQETAGGTTNYYKHIFITDWSNPISPKAIADYRYLDKANTENGGSLGLDNSIFYYEGYYYVPDNYGIDVIKRYDDSGKINMSYITTYVYDSEIWGTDKKVDVFVTGNYMWVWNTINYNFGYEARMKLSADKSEITEFCGFGQRNRERSLNDCNDIIKYGDRVYLMSEANLYEVMAPCINVIDLTRAMPVSVTINPIPKEVTLPYTISGECSGVNKVKIMIDDEDCATVPATQTESGIYKWQYTVTSSGEHSVLAAGVSFGGTVIKETAEYAQYRGISAEEISLSGDYSQQDKTVTANLIVDNRGEIDISGRIITGIYKDDILYALEISDEISVKKGESRNISVKAEMPYYLNGYTVKAFLIGGGRGFAPLTQSAELGKE